jgi:C2 domain
MRIAQWGVGVVSLGLAALVASGCTQHNWNMSSPGTGPSSSSFPSAWYEVYFTSATINTLRPDGAPWHTTPPDNASVVIGGLLGLAAGSPTVGLALGKALANPGGDPLAPIPYVVVKLAGRTYRIAAVQRAYTPTWSQPMAIDVRGLQVNEPVVIQIMDGADDSFIAQHEMKLSDLLARPSRTITNLGAVASLDVEVRPMSPRSGAFFDLTVPGNLRRDDLEAGRGQGWLPIPVWNGDTLTIAAGGEVCPSSWSRNDCFGPDGADGGRWSSYSVFKNVPHASLVGVMPQGNVYIGSSRQLLVEQAGLLLLFVNDEDVGNNRGEFQVRVRVDPPE